MKRILSLLFALAVCAVNSYAQDFLVGASFDVHCDNTEYTPTEFGGASRTDFTARLTPYVGVQFDAQNRLVFGTELWQDMGAEDDKFLSDVQPIIYYAFSSKDADVYAGIFDRRALMSNYSLAIFSEQYKFYESRLMGFMGRYLSGSGFVEFAISWEGKQSESVREKFRIISGGEFEVARNLRVGYGLSVLHFAESFEAKGVVDNVIFNPEVGYSFGDKFHYDITLGALVAPQCDRIMEEGWVFPLGGVLSVGVERWGVLLQNELYLGDNLQPFFAKEGYGAELYSGDSFYGTTKGIYNRTTVGYRNSFFDGLIQLEALMRFQYDGSALGTEQVINLRVAFDKVL